MKTFEELQPGDIIYRLKRREFVSHHVFFTSMDANSFKIATKEGMRFSIQLKFVKKSYSYTLITENIEGLRNCVMGYSFKGYNAILRKENTKKYKNG